VRFFVDEGPGYPNVLLRIDRIFMVDRIGERDIAVFLNPSIGWDLKCLRTCHA
jgi:hypothetical protein